MNNSNINNKNYKIDDNNDDNHINMNNDEMLSNDNLKEMLKIDIKKAFNLLKSINSTSSTNFCELLQLCSVIGEKDVQSEILSYVQEKNIFLPYKDVTESMLFTFHQNGELNEGLFYGLEVLKRNEYLCNNENININYNIVTDVLNVKDEINIDNDYNINIDKDILKRNIIQDDEFDSYERKLEKLQNLKTEKQVKNLIKSKFFPSKNFYFTLFSISADLGSADKSIDLYDYYEKLIFTEETDNHKKETKSKNNSYYDKNTQIKFLEEERLFTHTLQVLVVDSFMRNNSIFDGQCWALDRIVENVKKIKKYDFNIRKIQENNKHIKKRKDQIDIESSDLLLPILQVYLNNYELDEIKKLLLDLKDLNIPSNIILNCELILNLSGNGAIEETLEILRNLHNDKNIKMKEKLLLWEAAFEGCLHEKYYFNRSCDDYESNLFKKFPKIKKTKILPKAKAEQVWLKYFFYFFSLSVFLPHHLSFLFLCRICFFFLSFCNTKNNFLITKILFFSHFTFYLLFFLLTFYFLLFTCYFLLFFNIKLIFQVELFAILDS